MFSQSLSQDSIFSESDMLPLVMNLSDEIYEAFLSVVSVLKARYD